MVMKENLPRTNTNRATVEEGILVTIESYDPLNHRLRVKRVSDGQPLECDSSVEQAVSPPVTYAVEDQRVLKSSDDPNGPIIQVNDNFARLGGSQDYGFFSYGDGANFIKGPVSIVCTPDQVRMSALTTLNPLIVSGFPSTIVTPLPMCLWSLPGADAVASLLAGVTMAATLIAATA